jgi:hypothetical protein
MNFENLEVVHKAFGAGTVISKNGKYLTVKFAQVQKIFVYPDIFEKFLTLADGTVSEDIKNDISKTKMEKQQIIDKKNEENMKAMTKGIVVPGREITSTDYDDEDSRQKSTETEEI